MIIPEPRSRSGGEQTPTRQRMLELLRAAGYQVFETRRDWAECLLVRERERWFARGVDAEDAMRAALGLALPSELGWSLMLDALAPERAVESTEPRPAPESPAELEAGAEDNLPTPRSAPEATLPLEVPPTEAAPELRDEPAVSPPAESAPPPATGSAADSELKHLQKMSASEALTALDDLLNIVERERCDEFAQWSPPRQRLFLLGAVTRGRAIVEASGDDHEVFESMRHLANSLGGLAGRFWPGRVSALRLDCLPPDCHSDLGTAPEAAPQTWLEAAEMAEALLDQHIEESDERGLDEDGWADASEAPPAAPKGKFNEIVKLIEKLSGPLGDKPDLVEGGQLVAFDRTRRPELLIAARKLRWLRHAPIDPQRWGQAMGHLRFLAERAPGEFDALSRVVDEGNPCPGGWALALGIDPDKRAKQRAWKELLQSYIQGADEDQFRGWLRMAFDLPHAKTPKIASFLRQQKGWETVLALDTPSFSGERRHRTRLGKLQDALRADSTPAQALPQDPEEIESEAAPVASVEPAEHRAMLDAILPHTEGKRVLLLTNRGDSHKDALLKSTFGFARLRHEQTTKSKLASYKKSIAQRTVDMIIVASGFQPHAVDRALKPAADKAGVPYIRAHRAGKLACIRAIHRDLGL